MNTHQILKADETTNRIETGNVSDVAANVVSESHESNGPACNNGVCMVGWKPKKTAAA